MLSARFPVEEFRESVRLNPYWSSFTCFTGIIKGRSSLHPRTIKKYFDKLVEKEDYSKSDRFYLLKFLGELSKMPAAPLK